LGTALQRILRNLDDTRQLGVWLGERVRAGDVIALHGDLGVGKTALVKALASAWGGCETLVRSPTFALINVHELGQHLLVHADLYRLSEQDELQSCGLLDHLGDESAVVAIEWPELAEPFLPPDTIRIKLHLLPDNQRVVSVRLPPGR